MTQVQHVTAKEMTRRTGFKNALGYTYPEKDLILLRKGLKGKKKREVLEHETEHLEKGEEGPFLGATLGAVAGIAGNYLGAREQRKGVESSNAIQREQAAIARGDLAPYREFGSNALADYENWLASGGGQFSAPTMEDVLASPGYETRLGAIENSAAARGGLLSGNALRDIGEFGALQYDREYDRDMNEYLNEYKRRMGDINLGYGAAGGSAGIAQDLGQSLGQNALARGRAGANMWQGIGQNVAGGIGAYQGQKQWTDFLDKAYG